MHGVLLNVTKPIQGLNRLSQQRPDYVAVERECDLESGSHTQLWLSLAGPYFPYSLTPISSKSQSSSYTESPWYSPLAVKCSRLKIIECTILTTIKDTNDVIMCMKTFKHLKRRRWDSSLLKINIWLLHSESGDWAANRRMHFLEPWLQKAISLKRESTVTHLSETRREHSWIWKSS